MGIGDSILSTAEAKHYNEQYGLPVVFADKKTKKIYWDEVFENNPRILKRPENGQKVVVVENIPKRRPYIELATPERYYYNLDFRAEPGELFLSDEEKASGIEGAVLIEPNTKDYGLSLNKAWPWDRWQEVARRIDLPWVQLGPEESRSLDGVKRVVTKTFRDALGYIRKASLVVTTDGGLHHAAAALGVPAVVLWGGLAPHTVLGYDFHTNICKTDRVCGSFHACAHCHDAMNAITVDEVARAIEERTKRLAA